MKPELQWNRAALLQSPMFAPLHSLLERLDVDRFPALADLNDLLVQCGMPARGQSGKSLQFVMPVHDSAPFEAQYEPRCYLEGEVQTRPQNWHDLFNALIWPAFPAAKAAINARHYQALIEGAAVDAGQRGAGRDMLTLFDESGVIVVHADDELAGLLRTFQWKELFWRQRMRVNAAMGFYLFGHGLYEKAMQPYVGMTGQGLVLAVEREFFSWPLATRLSHLDKLLAAYLRAPGHCHNARELSPVPLLGVPGWAAANSDPHYYDNTSYFRPGRRGA
ncbi:MAG: DUF3025 domain-containing protein [Sideroxydans sp.]|nr:DUF3025 domain-containing protein [Sideroxydans sp.]